MKRSVCILLALCLILPCIALSEGWVCPSCGRQWDDADRFCGGCGEKRPTVTEAPAAVPTITAETVGRDYIEISWSGFTDAQNYRVYISDAGTNNWSLTAVVTNCCYPFMNLTPDKAYDVRVKSDNELECIYNGIVTNSLTAVISTATPTATPHPVQTAYPANLVNGLKYRMLSDGSIEIIGWTNIYNDIVLPQMINGRVVSSVGDQAFAGYYCLTSISIPDGVTRIGSSAFGWCYLLSSITLPDSVTSIGDYAFSGCGLTNITIPDSVTTLGANPFTFCAILRSVSVSPEHPTLEIIDGVLFSKPDKRLVYYPMSSAATAYTIPQGIQVIGDYAFVNCSNLTNITIPDSVTRIGYGVFEYCYSLTTLTVTPNSYAEQWCKQNGFSSMITYR